MWYRDQCKWCRVYFKPFEVRSKHNEFNFHERCIPPYNMYMDGIREQCQKEIQETLEKTKKGGP